MSRTVAYDVSGGGEPADRLAAYLAYVGSFATGDLRPASHQKIDRLRALVGVELPATYRRYLEVMGESSGRALRPFRAELGIDEAIEIQEEGGKHPEGCIAVGTGIMSVYADVCLQLDSGPDPRVVNADETEIVHPIADSFSGLLFQQAFLEFELDSRPSSLKFGVPHGRLALGEVRATFSRLGFSWRSFSDELNLCGARGDLRVGAFQLPGSFGWITLGGEPGAELEEVGESIASTLGLRRER